VGVDVFADVDVDVVGGVFVSGVVDRRLAVAGDGLLAAELSADDVSANFLFRPTTCLGTACPLRGPCG